MRTANWSSGCMLRTSTGSLGLDRLISRNTSKPLLPGMVMSSTTTSHLSFQTRLRASWALRASANSARRSSSARIWRKPLRTTAWSSTRRIFMADLGGDGGWGIGSDYDGALALRADGESEDD